MYNRQQISLYLITIASVVIVALVAAIVFTSSYAQDLNPPTTGTTTPNVTSRFGTNNTPTNSNMTNASENVSK